MTDHENLVLFISWVFGHIASVAAIGASLTGYLPPFAALIAFAWYTIQIAESDTFRGFLARRRQRKIRELEARLAQMKKHHNVLERSDT